MSDEPSHLSEENLSVIRKKRTETLVGVWKSLVKSGKLDESRLKLAAPLVNEVIEHYLSDLKILRMRYKIAQRIQLHKVAGLMTAAILRFRPIVPIVDSYTSEYEICANEILALFHGIAICGEYTARDGHLDIVDEPWFEPWFHSFLYLLHYRNYTTESLVFIFETLCSLRFPNNMNNLED